MAKTLNPTDIHPPFAPYSPGIEIPAHSRMILVSGQLGIAPDGSVPADCGSQTELCFANIAAILREGGLGLANIVKLNAYATHREHLAAYMAVRNRLFAAPYPASTLMIVSGFARPEFVVEIEAIAASSA